MTNTRTLIKTGAQKIAEIESEFGATTDEEQLLCYKEEATELRAAYEALQKENDELRLMINGSVLQIQAMQLQINAMKIGQKVLDGSIQAKSISDSEWREKYMREVEGLNNEGDPIGGDPPSGLRHSVEYLKSENAAQAKRIAELENWASSLFDTRTKNDREIELLRKYCNDQTEANALQMKMLEHQNKSLLDQLVKADLLAPRTYVIELPEGATLLDSASKNGE